MSGRGRLAIVALAAALAASSSAQAQFETRAVFPVAPDPYSLVVGDFNRDGIPDVAVLSLSSGGSVEILLGKGDGTFSLGVTYPVAAGFYGATARLRHNGILDLVVGADGYGVNVMLGNGDGTFQPAVSYPTEAESNMLALGDFTGHGKIDILDLEGANAQGACNCIQVLPGNGDGTFGAPISTTPVPYNVTGGAIATGDFNNDGKLDVAIAGAFFSTYQVDILLGNGDGTFTDDGYYVLVGSGAVAAGYFTSDKTKLDLAVTYGSGVGVLLGNGDGTFQPPVYYDANYLPVWLIAQDLDGDGNVDLAVANSEGPPGASVLKGNGDGTFQPPTFYPVGNRPNLQYIAAADFNNDGKPDLVVVGFDGEQVTTLLNTGSAIFSPTSPLTFSKQLLGTTSAPQSVTLTNSVATPMTISSVECSGPPFRLTENTCKGSLAPGAQCSIAAEFTAQTAGAVSGGITIRDSASSKPQFVELVGNASEVSIEPSRVEFPPQKTGTRSAPRTVTITNLGKTEMRFFRTIFIDETGYPMFSQSNDCGARLGPGKSCTITITFDPRKTGAYAAHVELEDHGGGSPQQIPLTGTGEEN